MNEIQGYMVHLNKKYDLKHFLNFNKKQIFIKVWPFFNPAADILDIFK